MPYRPLPVHNLPGHKPINIDYRPFQMYMQQQEARRRDKQNKRRLDLQEKRFGYQKDRHKQKGLESNLNKLDSALSGISLDGIYHDKMNNLVQSVHEKIAKEIKNGNPDWRSDLNKALPGLQSLENNYKTMKGMVDQKIADLSKDKAIRIPEFRNHITQKAFLNEDGSIKDLTDLHPEKFQQYNPYLDPDAGSYTDNGYINDQLVGLFPENTTAVNNPHHSYSVTAPSYIRVNPVTGHRTLKQDKVEADPDFFNEYFDNLKIGNNKYGLVKEPFAEKAMREIPGFANRVMRRVNTHNEGLDEGDPNYVDLNSPNFDLIKRAVATESLAQRGKTTFRSTFKNPKTSSGSENDKNDLSSLGTLDKFKMTLDQDPAIKKYQPIKKFTFGDLLNTKPNFSKKMASLIGPNPPKGMKIYDVSNIFKNYNVGKIGKKNTPAKGMYIVEGNPYHIYVDMGAGDIQDITLDKFPEWYIHNTQFNSKQDVMKAKKKIEETMGDMIKNYKNDKKGWVRKMVDRTINVFTPGNKKIKKDTTGNGKVDMFSNNE